MASIFKVLKMEKGAANGLERTLEPNLVMAGEQADSYQVQSDWGGNMDAVHLFHLSHLCQIIKENDNVIDLACGTGDLLAKLASLFPKAKFIGVDLSEDMLNKAKARVQVLNLTNVSFITQDISNISRIRDQSVDVITSTMALHHLPDRDILMKTAKEVKRILKSDGRLYLSDFLRLRSYNSIKYLVASNRNQEDQTFQLDFENSLLAAFSSQDIADFSNLFERTDIEFRKSRFVEFMFVLSTKTSSLQILPLQILKQVPIGKISWTAWLDFLRLKFILG